MTTSDSRTIETAAIEDTSLFAFYCDMNVAERHTFWACASGWALDGMDFMIYTLVIVPSRRCGRSMQDWRASPAR